ncbi:MAG: amidohydrolase family protein [Flavobacteriaceae bacterium]
MKRFNITLGYILVILASIACKNEGLLYNGAYIIEDIHLIDPVDGLKEHRSLVIKNNKIIEIFKTDEVEISRKNKIYSGSGNYLIPGLWDAHIHFAYQTELADAMPDLFLAHGITSVRDTGGEFNFVNGFKQDALTHPDTKTRVKIAGPLIDGKFNVYDGSSPNFPPLSIQNESVNQLQEQVQSLVDKEVDFLKAYEMLSPKQFEVLADIAKANNLKLTGHVPLSMDVITASNLGLSSMEHLRNVELSMSSDADALFQERQRVLKNEKQIKGSALRTSLHQKQRMQSVYNLDSTKIKEVVSVLSKNQTWQIPTLSLYKNFALKKYKNPSYVPLLNLLPRVNKEQWNEQIQAIDTTLDQQIVDYTVWSKSMVGYMHKRGIPFMAGTDTPIGFLIPGYSLHQELEELNLSGLSPLEVLQTATSNPAHYFNLQDSLGRIKKGYLADLVVLTKNPLDTISNTKTIDAVIKNGKYLNRTYLDSLLIQED